MDPPEKNDMVENPLLIATLKSNDMEANNGQHESIDRTLEVNNSQISIETNKS